MANYSTGLPQSLRYTLISFFKTNTDKLFIAIGNPTINADGVTADGVWDDEDNPPDPSVRPSKSGPIGSLLGAVTVSRLELVYADTNGNFEFNGERFSSVVINDTDTELDIYNNIYKNLETSSNPPVSYSFYVEGLLKEPQYGIPDGEYRQKFLTFDLQTSAVNTVDPTQIPASNITEIGIPLMIDNRSVIHRQTNQIEQLKFLIRF